jgi:peptidoglycan/LPS O-acetylase OafA/YrhL
METTQRQSYLDWLRIISIAGVLILHSGMPYAANLWWHIKDKDSSTLLFLLNIAMHLVRMPLLFFISGTVSYYMMQKRSALSFIGLRFTRLLVPLLVGMVLIVPPQIYMERLTQGYKGSYWEFYKTVFTFKFYPAGSFSWHHLWFIAYLFLYDLVFAPVFMWMMASERVKRFFGWLGKGKLVFLLAAPSVVWFTLVCNPFDEMPDLVHDWGYFVYWLLFVLAGFICILAPSLMDSMQRNRRFAMSIGFISLLMIYYFILNIDGIGRYGRLLNVALRPVTAWAWVFGLIGYGKQYLNRSHKVLAYLNQAVYPFYILHQTVIVILVYYITQYHNDSILMKYLFTIGVTFFITVGIFHYFIKPFAVMRFLFGMKVVSGRRNRVKKRGSAELAYVSELSSGSQKVWRALTGQSGS